jgi:hypothetical protein
MLRYRLEEVLFDGRRAAGRTAFAFTVPIRTINRTNVSEHPMVRHKRVLRERNAVALLWPRIPVQVPCAVHLVRVAPARHRLDDDGAVAAVKSIRDEVARLIGVDDGDARVKFTVAQEVGPWGVRVEISYQLGGAVLPERQRPRPKKRGTSAPKVPARAQARGGLKVVPNFIPARKP